jgi:hypothetical protein
MPDHLSIEVLGVLRGSADGPMAVAVLGLIGLMALTALFGALRGRLLKRLRSIVWRNAPPKSRRPKRIASMELDTHRATPRLG